MSDNQPFYYEYLEFLKPNVEDPRYTKFVFPNGCEFILCRLERHDDGKPADIYYCDVYFRKDGVRLDWTNRYCGTILSEEAILDSLGHFKNLEVKI